MKIYHNDAEVDACLDHLPDAGFNVLNWGKQKDIREVKRARRRPHVPDGQRQPAGDRACAARRTKCGTRRSTCSKASGGEGIILSVGGGVSPGMPRENILAMLEALEEFNAQRGLLRCARSRRWLTTR